jgi:YkoP domain
MSPDMSASAAGIVTALRSASAAWPDELWTGSVGWVDAILRSHYGIHEFTDDPACVLRVGLDQARAPASLSDGTHVEVGELVGTLHFWNEHLPRYSAQGPNFAWACAVRDRAIYSLRAFSGYIERAPDWQEVRAFRAETTWPARLGASQIGRVFQRYGFERVSTDSSFVARLHGLGECFLLWGLTRAFNPAALPRQPFLRDRYELWISRATLLARYARRDNQVAAGERGRADPQCSF